MPPPCPPGNCTQCWHHAYVVHRGNFLGIGEKPCAACESHMGGCPPEMIVPKPKNSFW